MGRNETESDSERERDEESGRFTEEYPSEELVAAIRNAGGAAGTQEVATTVGCSYETAYKKLRRLEDAGELTHRKVGNARLWEVEAKNGQ
jgi:transposase